MFWLDDKLESNVRLDAIITMIDAKYYTKGEVWNRQVGVADVVVINKTDTVTEEELEQCRAAVKSINAHSPVYETNRSQLEMESVIDVKAYTAGDLAPAFTTKLPLENHISSDISTFHFTYGPELDLKKVESWIQALLWNKVIPGTEIGIDILRLKALVNIHEKPKIILQGVRELYEAQEGVSWTNTEERESRFVMIGTGLSQEIRTSFDRVCL